MQGNAHCYDGVHNTISFAWVTTPRFVRQHRCTNTRIVDVCYSASNSQIHISNALAAASANNWIANDWANIVCDQLSLINKYEIADWFGQLRLLSQYVTRADKDKFSIFKNLKLKCEANIDFRFPSSYSKTRPPAYQVQRTSNSEPPIRLILSFSSKSNEFVLRYWIWWSRIMVELIVFKIRERKKKNPSLYHILYGTGRK